MVDVTSRKLAELQSAMDELKTAREQAESYIKQLEADVRQTLRLAKGLERIDEAHSDNIAAQQQA